MAPDLNLNLNSIDRIIDAKKQRRKKTGDYFFQLKPQIPRNLEP